MLPAVDPDKRIVAPAGRRTDTEARYTLTVIFRHESGSSSSGDDAEVNDVEHRSKDDKHVQEFVVRRVEPIIEWGEKHISLALALQVNILFHSLSIHHINSSSRSRTLSTVHSTNPPTDTHTSYQHTHSHQSSPSSHTSPLHSAERPA